MSKMTNLAVIIIVTLATAVHAVIERPRGVPPASASQYQPGPGDTFRCLSDRMEIAFEYVNDDYCDCEDGSDEPGTSACSNMKFFCLNKGHVSEDILSSRVNDGICDCCDGSDEYLQDKIQCTNTCEELGFKRREEMQRERELRDSGAKIKKDYMVEGLRERESNMALVEELEKTKETLTVEREDLERQKSEAEAPEKEAKEKHEKAWEELKAERQAVKDRQKAVQAFQQLDANSDRLLTVNEMQDQPCFDKNRDGSVSGEEIKEYLEDLEHAAEDDFIEKIWPNIKEIYKAPEVPTEEVTPPVPDDAKADEGKKEEEVEEEKMPDYDEDTKKLIEVADEARRVFDEADKKVKEIESQINTAKKFLEKDFGADNEFAFLYNKCFEYTEREYTYKLCPFDRASQRQKSGGSETSLGVWGHWDGSSNDKYSAQKYEKGQNCWNGPDRSVKVLLRCGVENELLSASEPSRCEYQFEFSTPARCTAPSPEEYQIHDHDEL